MRGFSAKAWNTLKAVLSLSTSSWGGGYSYQSGWQYQADDEGEWVLHYYIDIDLEWSDMTCSERDYYSAYMASGEWLC